MQWESSWGASSLVLEGISDVETLEALACREGLALAGDLMLSKIRLASDCINVVRSMRGAGMGPYGHVVQDIKAYMRDFQAAEIIHEDRRFNVDAHKLARNSGPVRWSYF